MPSRCPRTPRVDYGEAFGEGRPLGLWGGGAALVRLALLHGRRRLRAQHALLPVRLALPGLPDLHGAVPVDLHGGVPRRRLLLALPPHLLRLLLPAHGQGLPRQLALDRRVEGQEREPDRRGGAVGARLALLRQGTRTDTAHTQCTAHTVHTPSQCTADSVHRVCVRVWHRRSPRRSASAACV